MMFRKMIAVALLSLGLLPAGAAWADVFNLGGGLTSVVFVPVGEKNNLPDPDTTFGSVDHDYNIGKYDVTAGQYCEFLNAVAKNADPYSLYNSNMNIANYSTGCNVVRSVSGGKYSYSVASDWANRPVNFVSWGDAVRFCNWLQNGQKIGDEDDSTTESGAYTLGGANTDALLMTIIRNPNASYFIPTLNESYKAAYYDPNKYGPGIEGYWLYPTKSDMPPINILSSTGTNNANFLDRAGTGTHTYTIGAPYYRTEVGSFAASPSPYGTFDQGGNVELFVETAVDSFSRGAYGTSYSGAYSLMSTSSLTGNVPTWEKSGIGFRIACSSVPEPSILLMLLLSSITAFVCWHRHN